MAPDRLIGGHEAIGPPWGHGTTLEPWDYTGAMGPPWGHGESLDAIGGDE